MEQFDIGRLIDIISWGCISATILDKNNSLVSFLLRNPTLEQQGKAAMVYSTEYQRGIISGLSAKKDVILDMIATKQWDHKIDIQIEGLRKDIYNIRRGLLDFAFNSTKLEKYRAILRRAENALIERLSKKHTLLQNSAEAHALICQQRYLIGRITETKDGKSFWPEEKDFEEFDDINMVIQLCELFFRKSRVPTEYIRQIARSQQWRMYWEVVKHTNNLFDGNVARWSADQRELAYWSTVYDSVYDAYERPSMDIIVDDDLLDSWFIRQQEKIDAKTNRAAVEAPVYNRDSKKGGRNEQFIIADGVGAKKIYDMNDPISKAKIRARQKVLHREGIVKEQNMPDSQAEMRQQLTVMQRERIKNIGHKRGS